MTPIRLVAYSDYLCPWCYNASVRLHRLEDEVEGVEVSWRSYLLRRHPAPGRDLEKFRHYTRSWQRPAAEPDAGRFQEWVGDAGPPSHSLPAQLVAKAAAELGPASFRAMHERLLAAYFRESRDISDPDTLRALWDEAGLPPADFERQADPALYARVIEEHEEATRLGATGVPSVRLETGDAVVTGALPYESYRRWVDKLHARAASGGR